MDPILDIQLLGELRIAVSDGRPVAPALQHARKIALLAVLAVEKRAVTRGELGDLLWATTDARARRSLSQVLHSIRDACGFDPFMVEGDAIRLDPARVRCDIRSFYDAHERDAPAQIVRQYRGPLLPGFVVAGAREFNDWLARERERFDIALADAAWRAAEQADAPSAVELLEIAAAARPWDQGILRRRMRTLAGLDEHAVALALYESYRTLLREAIGTAPAPETAALAQQIAAHPHARAHAREQLPPAPARDDDAVSHATPATPNGRWLRPRNLMHPHRIAQISAACVLIAALVYGGVISRRVAGSDVERPLVALSGVTITGGDAARRNDVLQRLTALLADDTTFAVATTVVGRPRAIVSGSLELGAGVRGTVVFKTRTGTVLATLPLAYTSESDATAMHDAAKRIRLTLLSLLAPTAEQRAIAAFELRLHDAQTYASQGAYDAAAAALDGLQRDVATARLTDHTRRILLSHIWERRAWDAFRQGEILTTVNLFERAIDVMNGSDNNRARERRMHLHFALWTFKSEDSRAHLDAIVAQARGIAPAERSSAVWFNMSRALYHLGDYAPAYSAADAARARSPAARANLELAMLLFRAAFNQRNHTAAEAECATIERTFPGTPSAFACATLLAAWAGGSYDLNELLRSLERIEEPEPYRTVVVAEMSMLLAAACARRGDAARARMLLQTTPLVTVTADQQVFRAAALTALGRTTDANAALRVLQQTAAGRRALRSYARLLEQ